MRRREIVLGAGAALGGVPLSGCAAPSSDGPTPPAGTALADIHCHVFNGSDLPTIRFIKIVVLGHYPKQAIKTLDIDDPDVVDGLIALFTWIVGRTRAPSADDEIRVLDGQLKSSPQNLTDEANEEAVIDALASFAQPGGVAATGDQPTSGVRKVRRAIFKAAGENGVAAANKPLSNPEAKAVAGRAYRSKFDLGLLLRWFALFTRYRHVLVDKLAADHKRQKFGPALLCPALIDYDNWLGEKVTKSNLPAQVKVMGRISRRPTGPAVHGYVAFDPLRQVLFDRGVHTDFDPLGLARTALRDEGFMGVKLYPPMGFKASGNRDDRCQTYPDSLVFDKLLEGQPADAGTEGCSPRPADG